MNNPNDLRRQAHELAAKAKGAKAAWTDLSKWSMGKGPLAIKSAIIEFMSSFGSSPEAARMMPELIRSASQFPNPAERRQLLELTTKTMHQPSIVSPKMNVPSEKDRPALSLSFNPRTQQVRRLGATDPLSPSADHAAIRDIHLNVKERMTMQLYTPPAPRPDAPHFDASKSPDSFAMGAASHQGSHLMKNLIHNVRSHSREPGYKHPEEPPRRRKVKAKVMPKAKPKMKAKPKSKAKAKPKMKARPKMKAKAKPKMKMKAKPKKSPKKKSRR